MSADDRSAVDEVVAAFYAAFDNRAGRTPSQDALLALFTDEATVTRVDGAHAVCWTPLDFAAPRVAILTDGTLTDFHEWETDAETFVSGRIAARWSSYRKAGRRNGAVEVGGGRKVIQLRRGGTGWRIASVLWEDDASG